jgi:hypothetical protein
VIYFRGFVVLVCFRKKQRGVGTDRNATNRDVIEQAKMRSCIGLGRFACCIIPTVAAKLIKRPIQQQQQQQSWDLDQRPAWPC